MQGKEPSNNSSGFTLSSGFSTLDNVFGGSLPEGAIVQVFVYTYYIHTYIHSFIIHIFYILHVLKMYLRK